MPCEEHDPIARCTLDTYLLCYQNQLKWPDVICNTRSNRMQQISIFLKMSFYGSAVNLNRVSALPNRIKHLNVHILWAVVQSYLCQFEISKRFFRMHFWNYISALTFYFEKLSDISNNKKYKLWHLHQIRTNDVVLPLLVVSQNTLYYTRSLFSKQNLEANVLL